MTEHTEPERYVVVVNDRGQYSIWERESAPPAGWYDAGFEGDRDDCLAHIERTWRDI
ncbi:MbtH family protein [Actinopolyspora erythraea]|uniref:Antibiotic synthesis protein MbtH n=1 Tax=Actinopolyspora erythraea TaxID=414996 RepID=A0A099D9Q8_9ACTN|nr:MbtH family NRPS accessory protein [Actinopolyspora erythraea]ASU80422.1 MbtH family protein [Actinopolyspora erythraea]KGI82908.1 antibiotic synthesis protein MbtH [Actinopolyspora erythraea]